MKILFCLLLLFLKINCNAADFYYTGEIIKKDATPFDDNLDNISKVMIVNMKNNVIGNNQLNYKKATLYTLRDVINQKLHFEKNLNKKFDSLSYNSSTTVEQNSGNSQMTAIVNSQPTSVNKSDDPKKNDYGKFELKNRLYKGKLLVNYQYQGLRLENDVNILPQNKAYDGKIIFNYKNNYFSMENKYVILDRKRFTTSISAKPVKFDSIEVQPHVEYSAFLNMVKSEIITRITPELHFVYENDLYFDEKPKINSYNLRYTVGF